MNITLRCRLRARRHLVRTQTRQHLWRAVRPVGGVSYPAQGAQEGHHRFGHPQKRAALCVSLDPELFYEGKKVP